MIDLNIWFKWFIYDFGPVWMKGEWRKVKKWSKVEWLTIIKKCHPIVFWFEWMGQKEDIMSLDWSSWNHGAWRLSVKMSAKLYLWRNHKNYLVAVEARALYSASVEKQKKVLCFFENQEIKMFKLLLRNTTRPVVYHLAKRSPAQSTKGKQS